MSDWMIICSFLKKTSYLYHKGDPQRDEEIDVEERDGEGGKTETMNVCMYVHMYEWMDVYGRREVLVLTSLMVFLMHVYALQDLASRPDM
jgi:hypothetical protein